MIEFNKIYNEDCLIGMSKIPDGSIDMILCDLPYGTTNNHWDIRIPFEPLWAQYKRITKKNAAIVLFSQLPFGSDLIQSNRKMYRYEWIWEKYLATGFLNSHKMPLRAHENILVFYQKLPTYNPQMTEGKPYVKIRKAEQYTKNYSSNCLKKEWLGINKGTRYPRDVLKCHTPYSSGVGKKSGGGVFITLLRSLLICWNISLKLIPTKEKQF